MTDGCAICSRAIPPAKLVYQDELWSVRHSDETNILGYLILQSRRHILDLSEATEEEASSYGSVLCELMSSIRKTIDCERIYTFSLAEMVPHFHVHLIPRTGYMPRIFRGRGVMSYPLQPVADPHLVESTCDRLRRQLRFQEIR
jgi:diadenosine tetraphosphate (Ap4A) HIT family hydrolase